MPRLHASGNQLMTPTQSRDCGLLAELVPTMCNDDHNSDRKRDDRDTEWSQSIQRPLTEVRAAKVVFQYEQSKRGHHHQINALRRVAAAFEKRVNCPRQQR